MSFARFPGMACIATKVFVVKKQRAFDHVEVDAKASFSCNLKWGGDWAAGCYHHLRVEKT